MADSFSINLKELFIAQDKEIMKLKSKIAKQAQEIVAIKKTNNQHTKALMMSEMDLHIVRTYIEHSQEDGELRNDLVILLDSLLCIKKHYK